MEKRYYSPGAKAFYVSSRNSDIPEDAIEIDQPQHAHLLDGLSQGRRVSISSSGDLVLSDAEDAPLEDVRALTIADIERARDAAIAGGFDFNGIRFDSDAKSIQRINGAVTLSLLNPAFETDWITFDNSVVRLNAAQLAGLGAAAGQHEATQIFRARQLKDQALAATTREQLAGITW